ncbi:MAG: hypothetical protein K8T25_21700 [Planctomycetia bacterium]|nr:hypothetical protein [Planctomycetia bacterium]
MRLTMIYTTQVKALLGQSTEQIDTDNLGLGAQFSAAQLLTALAAQHGAAFGQMVLDPGGQPAASLLVCVGDEQAATAGPLTVRDGDTITLLSAISGG